MPPARFFLAVVIVLAPLCTAGQGLPGAVAFTWSPTSQQEAIWKATAGDRLEPPVVSLKAALPGGVGPCQLEVLDAQWQPETAGASPGPPPAMLGARGFWHGIAYQEVLIRPVHPDEAEAPKRLLKQLEVRITFESPQLSAEASGRSKPALPESPLFQNPRDVVRKSAQAAPRTPLEKTGAAPAGLRVSLQADGIYHLSAQYLQDHGFDLVGSPAENIHLTCRGLEIPVAITGPKKKNFGKKNGILFYGQKLAIRDRPLFNGGDFSDTNVYWLSVDETAGLRMQQASVAPGAGFPLVSLFSDAVHAETNNFFGQTYHFRPNGDNWFWAPPLAAPAGSPSPSYTYTLSLPHAAAGEVSLKAVFAGLNDARHAVSASLNGRPATGGEDPAEWTGKSLKTALWTFSEGVRAGENTLTLDLPGSPSQPDFQFLDYFEISYLRAFEAENGALRFTDANSKARYVARGFSAKPLALDLSTRDAETGLFMPVLLKGVKFASGKATFEMQAASSPGDRAVALSSSPLLPETAEAVFGTDLADPALGADLLILTHPRFHPAGQDAQWQEYLEARRLGLEVLAVDIQEVFDQFSHGLLDPTAIRAFLAAASSSWRKPPRYVLLIGDATYDYKNYKADPALQNWVPTMMFEDMGDWEYLGRYPSDAWYSDLDGDGYPDVPVGRLPARSYEELAGILGKILAYEGQLPGDWASAVLYVADTYNQPWEQEFEAFSDHLRETYTGASWSNRSIYFHDPPYGGTDADAAAAAIRAAWPSALVHFTGHSGIGAWGNVEKIFTSYPSRNCSGGTCADSDVDLLPPIQTGEAPLPFVLNATCYVSAFDEAGSPCLMEALLARPDGGCVGSAGFSTIAYLDEEEAYSEAIFGMLFGHPGTRTIGDLVEAGRFALPSSNQRSVMGSILLGDPSLQLKMPPGQ